MGCVPVQPAVVLRRVRAGVLLGKEAPAQPEAFTADTSSFRFVVGGLQRARVQLRVSPQRTLHSGLESDLRGQTLLRKQHLKVSEA